MMVADVMITQVITVGSGVSVASAVQLMDEHNISCLPVLEEGRLVGIITARDVRNAHPNRLVADAMTAQPLCVAPDDSLEKALRLLNEKSIEKLPVVQGDRLIGMVTRDELRVFQATLIDWLTGLPRVPYVYLVGKKYLEQGQDFSIIFIDLDNFGAIDKKVGHAQADRLLQSFAKFLQNTIDPMLDKLARYAGDEFVILTFRSLDAAAFLARKIIQHCRDGRWDYGVNLSCSAGISHFSGRNHRGSPDELLGEIINVASLASTRAKKMAQHVCVVSSGSL
ncbi:MAG: GGDEF domain-containing protein [Bacillota bacterium]|uniref:GGDEF domain-containing protein n=1 Tax=Desulfurispora thermophila TaxID=265470 RepID=UPI00038122B5|nr:GGDEF domain-containing protein [Desulfurispora thermophila]